MMKTFKIVDGDLVFDGQNNLVIVEDIEEEAQSIERILTTNKNEWFLDVDFGLDYQAIQGKGKDKESIALAIIEAIHQDDRVEEIEYINIDFNRKNRNIKVDFRVKMKSGSTIEGSEVL